MNESEALIIPGMIESNEIKLLFNSASKIVLNDNDQIIEFGAFFGRSTNCIAQGLLANPTYNKNCKFLTYDSFECDEDGWFAIHVVGHAKAGKVIELIQRKEKKKINFFKIFEHYLTPYIDKRVVYPVVNELLDSKPEQGEIALIHIDSPKYYEEFKTIFYRFLPKTRVGSVIIFQDFFYHWSASLILVVAILIEKKYIVVESSAATSLACKVLKIPGTEEILEIDLMMQNENVCLDYFEVAVNACNKEKIDRYESFVPRIILAKIQWLYSKKRYSEAADTITNYLKGNNSFGRGILDDFLEMLKHGFSIRKLFEKDHQ